MEPNIGIKGEDRKAVAEDLNIVLADSYSLYLMLHNFHWNVKGKHFYTIHEKLEEQYDELAEAIDEVAERIRALGEFAPGTFSEFLELRTLKDPEQGMDEMSMVKEVLKAHEHIATNLKTLIPKAEDVGDAVTVDLYTQRMAVHEKTAWMLRSVIS